MGSRPAASCSLLSRLLFQCTEQRDLLLGRSLHARVIKTGSSADSYLGNSLINLYAKCGRMAEAMLSFDEIKNKDVVSWNCLINSYAQQGPAGSGVVIELFQKMRAEGGAFPNSFTFSGVFTAASYLAESSCGVEAHSLAVKIMGFGDVFVGSSLLNMYCKLGLLCDARRVFDRMPWRNSVSWAAMLSGYAVQKSGDEAFMLFRLLLEEGECSANEFVLTSVLSAVAHQEYSGKGWQIHCLAIKDGLCSFVSVRNSLVTMYAKCGQMQDAVQMFESSSDTNSITWSAMITGYAQNGNSSEALRLFSEMHFAGMKPSEFTFVGVLNACSDGTALVEGKQVHTYLSKLGFESQMYTKSALVDMYAKCGSLDDAQNGFNQILEPDVVLWTTMIGGYAQNGENEEALSLYRRMEMEGVFPNDLTMVSILRACSCLAALELGKQIHACIIKYGFDLEVPIGSALLTVYAKCGDIKDCYNIFRRMTEKDVVAWNSVISGFAQNGQGSTALELFDAMKLEGTEPDHVTFVNILSACSHMGLVERGWSYLRSMHDDHGLTPMVEHYACMVDILSRAGKLREAKDLIESVPIEHGICLWRILLGACRNYRNFDIGAYAGERLMELGSRDSSAYILLSSIYAASGRWQDMERVRRTMRLLGVNKEPGCSWVEFNGKVHAFVVGDDQHPVIGEIQAEVRRLAKQMKDEDYEATCEPHFHFFTEINEEIDDPNQSHGLEHTVCHFSESLG